MVDCYHDIFRIIVPALDGSDLREVVINSERTPATFLFSVGLTTEMVFIVLEEGNFVSATQLCDVVISEMLCVAD